MYVSVKRDCITSGLINVVDSVHGSNITEELFIVFNDNFWWKLFWVPSEKQWKTTVHQFRWKNSVFLNTKDLNKILFSLKDELIKSKGFEYKNCRGTIVYKIET